MDCQPWTVSDSAVGASQRASEQNPGTECPTTVARLAARYGHRPVLLETLVDAQRFRGTCYRASNWIHIGQTTGRGRMDREHENHGRAIKDIYVYPLVRDARQRLCTDPTR